MVNFSHNIRLYPPAPLKDLIKQLMWIHLHLVPLLLLPARPLSLLFLKGLITGVTEGLVLAPNSPLFVLQSNRSPTNHHV